MSEKKTMVIGASENRERYSNMAIHRLRQHNHSVVAIGNRKGKVEDVDIITEHPDVHDIDTITLYLNPQNQKAYYDYILSVKPKRIIFNPGTENEELEHLAEKEGIQTMEACTLVLLGTGQY
ncbi:CoA-binding protein [Taibaiella soli]|uniref:CoA-binding protein n=1 Tax=Taibaiella soli TaxID=1649169 RepID=A0A2W2BLU9_9BACT|nr:CoA-binding protein [Taibaiella soli]PZF74416.1 CoA-binding protein [Taibaiella soli]